MIKNTQLPKIITLRTCPNCYIGINTFSVHGFAYPAGDDSKWKCYGCDYVGKPKYIRYNINLKEIIGGK